MTADAIARQLGIDEVRADVLPGGKRAVVEELQRAGRLVAMAGDGINDAPALAQATVGIAMGTGTDVAIESAGITLVKGDLRGIVRARRLSRATVRNIRQNLFLAFIYNTLGVPIAAGVLFPFAGMLISPIWASAAMTLSSLSVIVNALRLRKARPLEVISRQSFTRSDGRAARRILSKFPLQGSPFLMPSLFVRYPCRTSAVAALLLMAARGLRLLQDRNRAGARPRRRRPSRSRSKRSARRRSSRNVEVVGTLAAVDEVTISSEADGKVSRILADLGDRVQGGDRRWSSSIARKQQYNLDQQRAALARALAQYGAPDPQHLPAVEKTPDVQKASADLAQAKQAYDRASELFKRTLVPQQTLDDAATRAAVEAGELRLVAAERQEPARRASTPPRRAMKLADRQLRDTYIRAPFDGYVAEAAGQPRRARQDADAGDDASSGSIR